MKSPWVTGAVQIWSEIVVELWQFLSSVNIQVVGAHEKKKNYNNYTFIVCTPPFLQGCWASNQILKMRRLDKNSVLEGVAGKDGGWFFSGGVAIFTQKIKSEIFNDKKSLQAIIFFTVITKNSNWEILPKNLVNFKR